MTDTDTPDDEHDRELFSLNEGDEATLTLADGSLEHVAVTGKETHHSDDGPHISEQTIVRMERIETGEPLMAGITDGLSGIEDADPFPSFIQLHESEHGGGRRVPDEALLGYVTGVKKR